MSNKLIIFLVFLVCATLETIGQDQQEMSTWAERLGYPPDKIILILHADDVGMCEEANISTIEYLLKDQIQSAAAMPPCPNFSTFISWAVTHPQEDIGLHLALTSEWRTHRWGPVAPIEDVPGLLDSTGHLWRSVEEVVQHATAAEVELEIRAQIEKSIALGHRPDHIDTHMGTLYGSPAFTEVYLKVAQEYGIPAMVIDINNPFVLNALRSQGYPATKRMIDAINAYSLPKLDYFYSVPWGKTYAEKRQNLYDMIDSWRPGLTEIIFHPSEGTEYLKEITGSWQQRIWEAEMFADQEVREFLEKKGIVFTNWQEIMERFERISK